MIQGTYGVMVRFVDGQGRAWLRYTRGPSNKAPFEVAAIALEEERGHQEAIHGNDHVWIDNIQTARKQDAEYTSVKQRGRPE